MVCQKKRRARIFGWEAETLRLIVPLEEDTAECFRPAADQVKQIEPTSKPPRKYLDSCLRSEKMKADETCTTGVRH